MVPRGGGYSCASSCEFFSMGFISSDEGSSRVGLGLALVFIFSKYLGKACFLPVTVLGAGDIMVIKLDV